MRSLTAATAVAALIAVGLVGCAGAPGPECPRPAQDPTLATLVTAEGEQGSAPEVSVATPLRAQAPRFADLIDGSGPAVVEPDQLFVTGLTLVDGESGEVLTQNGYDASFGSVGTTTEAVSVFPGIEEALQCAREGSRIAVLLPPDGLTPLAAAGLGIDPDASVLAVADIRKVYLPAADGAPVFHDAHGLPSVVRGPSGQPGIIVPDAAAPTEVVVQVLLEGREEVVQDGDGVRVHYTAVSWEGRDVRATSWGGPAVSVTAGPGDPVAAALVGARVGSQILVVLPEASSPSGSALVYVVDVLGVDGAPR